MSNPPYEYNREHTHRYTFESIGKRTITKVVEFSSTEISGVYNMAFGDRLPNDEIDDTVKSNNGDIIKVLATVIDILQDFTEENPSLMIFFTGSTPLRTLLYKRILKTYYQSFSGIFNITGVIESDNERIEIPFDPRSPENYLVFSLKEFN